MLDVVDIAGGGIAEKIFAEGCKAVSKLVLGVWKNIVEILVAMPPVARIPHFTSYGLDAIMFIVCITLFNSDEEERSV